MYNNNILPTFDKLLLIDQYFLNQSILEHQNG